MATNYIGNKFGRLTVLKFSHKRAGNNYFHCQCDCGNKIITRASYLNCGRSKSCGCLRLEINTHHGLTRSPEWNSWESMKKRCTYETKDGLDKNFKNYGGRGIKIYGPWLHGNEKMTGFECFLSDVGFKPDPSFTLERINNSGNYEPFNVRWASKVAQANNRRSTLFITYNGEKISLANAVREYGKVGYLTAWRRLQRGMSPEEALA